MAFTIRTEELGNDAIEEYYVPTDGDNEILDKLQSCTPVILEGSRGMGKSFMFRVSQIKVEKETSILPIHLTFRAMPTLLSGNAQQFYIYMLSRISATLIRALKKKGYISNNNWVFGEEMTFDVDDWPIKLENINKKFENSWKKPGDIIDTSDVPTIDDLLELAEDICESTDIERIIFYIDEAAHVFIPEQQIQFFSLFRELRSPYVKCNAAVYPGVTYYGPTFDKVHDAEFISMSRNITSSDYLERMKEMVICQVKDENVLKALQKNDERFSVLAYAASGNPRTLLKSIEKLEKKFNVDEVNKFIREFYREEMWAEHSSLAEKYTAREKYIEWGRRFVEDIVISELKNKNEKLLSLETPESTIFFWIHKSAPQAVKEALKILEYTGIIKLHTNGVKGTGSVIGTRYEVNFGCILSQETSPATKANDIIKSLSLRRFSEYGANSKYFSEIKDLNPEEDLKNMSSEFKQIIQKPIDELELTTWQKGKLKEINIDTIEKLLVADENDLKKICYVGDLRSRQMKNIVMAAVFEYLY